MVAVPKHKRIVCRRYLRWIKTKPCVIAITDDLVGFSDCSGPIDPHHVIPRSLGGADTETLPACRKHHEQIQRLIQLRPALSLIAKRYYDEYWRENPPKARKERKRAMRVKIHVLNCSACGHSHEVPWSKLSNNPQFGRMFQCINKRSWVNVQ